MGDHAMAACTSVLLHPVDQHIHPCAAVLPILSPLPSPMSLVSTPVQPSMQQQREKQTFKQTDPTKQGTVDPAPLPPSPTPPPTYTHCPRCWKGVLALCKQLAKATPSLCVKPSEPIHLAEHSTPYFTTCYNHEIKMNSK